jgi:hypothetical protein
MLLQGASARTEKRFVFNWIPAWRAEHGSLACKTGQFSGSTSQRRSHPVSLPCRSPGYRRRQGRAQRLVRVDARKSRRGPGLGAAPGRRDLLGSISQRHRDHPLQRGDHRRKIISRIAGASLRDEEKVRRPIVKRSRLRGGGQGGETSRHRGDQGFDRLVDLFDRPLWPGDIFRDSAWACATTSRG